MSVKRLIKVNLSVSVKIDRFSEHDLPRLKSSASVFLALVHFAVGVRGNACWRVARPLIWNLWVPCPRRGEGGAFASPMAGFSRFFLVAGFRQTLMGAEDHIGADRISILP